MRKKIKKSLIIGTASIAFGLGVFGICDASINNNVFLAQATSEADYTMEFVAGASVRTTPDSMGIRYTANFGSSIYELVQSGDENAEVGIIIVPEKALANADSSTDYFDYLAKNFGKSKESISTSFRANHFTANDDGTYKATASIINIKDNNLALEYQAVTYYTLDNVNYVYSSKSDARTISYVANAALQSNALSETQREDTLETSIVLSDRLEQLGKTSQSDFTANTTIREGLDLTPYISNGRTIASVTFNGVERTPDANNIIALTEADEVAQTHTVTITYNEKATVDVEEQVEALVEETPTENSSGENATEDTRPNTLNLVLSVGIEQDVTVYMGLENSPNLLTKNDVFGYDSSQTIIEIKDQRNRTVGYDNTLGVAEAIKLPSGLTAGREYEWKVSDGTKFYFINVFVATNVIRSWSDFSGLFTSTEGSTYYTQGADGYYVLANDIDASGEIHTHPYVDMNGVGLTGTFDGLGHTIDGLTIASYANYTRDDVPKYSGGLFANITRGEVKNLNVTNMKFTSEEIGGEGIGLAKYIKNSAIMDVSMEITEVSSKAWANFALAYETPAILGLGRTFLTNVTIKMLPKASNAYVLGNSFSLADSCKYTNVQITSNNPLFRKDVTLKDEDKAQITHIAWVSSELPQYLFTTDEVGYQKTAEFDAYILHNGGVSTQNVEVLFSNPNVVSYENDTITALANGETTVSLSYYNTNNGKTYTIELGVITVVKPVIEADKQFYFGTADTDNRLFVSDFAPNNKTFEIETITDNNGVAIGYDKETGIITVPDSVEVGEEYTWTLDNGYYEYTVNVFVATNVIKTIDDLDAFFNYSASKDYYNTGANGYYVLANNIDASGYTHAHGKTDSSGIGLTGTFDGRGYAIDGITLTNAGLFGYVKGGTIKNVALTNVTVQSSGEAYVITRQSAGMTIDNVFISVAYTEDSSSWNQGLFEKAWGAVSVSNVMVVATGGNANAFALGAMYASGNPANYTYTNVYAISALSAVRAGEATGITIYADVATFKANVAEENWLFAEYWNNIQ